MSPRPKSDAGGPLAPSILTPRQRAQLVKAGKAYDAAMDRADRDYERAVAPAERKRQAAVTAAGDAYDAAVAAIRSEAS